MTECKWCPWPPRYKVYRGASGKTVAFEVCPKHLGLAVDSAQYKGRALVQIIE